MARTIHRHEIPVDRCWHPIELTGDIIHVDTRRPEVVEFWTIHDTAADPTKRVFGVYGTGDNVPDGAVHVGTAVAGPLVWHLLEQVTGR